MNHLKRRANAILGAVVVRSAGDPVYLQIHARDFDDLAGQLSEIAGRRLQIKNEKDIEPALAGVYKIASYTLGTYKWVVEK